MNKITRQARERQDRYDKRQRRGYMDKRDLACIRFSGRSCRSRIRVAYTHISFEEKFTVRDRETCFRDGFYRGYAGCESYRNVMYGSMWEQYLACKHVFKFIAEKDGEHVFFNYRNDREEKHLRLWFYEIMAELLLEKVDIMELFRQYMPDDIIRNVLSYI